MGARRAVGRHARAGAERAWGVDLAAGVAGMAALAVAVGVIESTIARLRLVRVPQFLVAASVLSILALVLVMR